jgi:hypothetical protein
VSAFPNICSVCKDRRRIYRTTPPGEGWWPCPGCYRASDGEYTTVAPMTDLRELCWHVLGYVPMDGGVSEAQAMEWVVRARTTPEEGVCGGK